MGASSPNGGRGRSKRRGFAEINVTPMVDIMLVLLIIFMVAAPMMTSGVNVDLPKAQSSPIQGQDEPLTVSIQKSGKVFINKDAIKVENLGVKLKAIIGEKADTRILVRGDSQVDYGKIMQVVGAINAAGFTKVALITDQVDNNKDR
jgi:biopolymer transport protein TolR